MSFNSAGDYYYQQQMCTPYYQQPQCYTLPTGINGWSYISGSTITITEPIQPVAVSERKFIVVDVGAGSIAASFDKEQEADEKAEQLASDNDRRYVVFRPILVHEPEKKTRRRKIDV